MYIISRGHLLNKFSFIYPQLHEILPVLNSAHSVSYVYNVTAGIYFFSVVVVVTAAATVEGRECAANKIDMVSEGETKNDRKRDGERETEKENTMKETTNSPNDKDTTTRRFCSENIPLTWKILLSTLLMFVEHFSSCFHCCCGCFFSIIFICICVCCVCVHACEYTNRPCDYFSFRLFWLVYFFRYSSLILFSYSINFSPKRTTNFDSHTHILRNTHTLPKLFGAVKLSIKK